MTMPYNRDELLKKAKEATVKNKLFFIEDIAAFCGISKTTLYEHFPVGSNDMNELKALLEENKIKVKAGIRAKLYKSSKSGELISLYKLIGTTEERKKLSMNYVDLSNEDGSLKPPPAIDLSKLDDDTIRKVLAAQRNNDD